MAWAPASAESLWKEIEDKLPNALTAMDEGTLFGKAGYLSVIKAAIVLHFVRSKTARILTKHRQLLACWFYGLLSAGDEALGMFADESWNCACPLPTAARCGASGSKACTCKPVP